MTDAVVTIGTRPEADFPDWPTWELDQVGDLVSQGIAEHQVQHFNDWPGTGMPFTAGFQLSSSWVTDDTHKIVFMPAPGDEHGGVEGAGFFVAANVNGTPYYVFETNLKHIEFRDFEMRQAGVYNLLESQDNSSATRSFFTTGTAKPVYIKTVRAKNQRFESCLMRMSSATNAPLEIQRLTEAGLEFINCHLQNDAAGGPAIKFSSTFAEANDFGMQRTTLYADSLKGSATPILGGVLEYNAHKQGINETLGTNPVTGVETADYVLFPTDMHPADGGRLDDSGGAVPAFNDISNTPYITRDVGPYIADAAGPAILLDAPTETDITATTATIGCDTDTASGQMWVVVTQSATPPTAAQIKLGQDDTGSPADYADTTTSTSFPPITFPASGLTEATNYYNYFYQEDGGDVSNILESGLWATLSAQQLDPQGVTQPQSMESVSYTQSHLLAIQPASQSQVMDTVSVTLELIVAVQSVIQSQTMDSVFYTQDHSLSLASVSQSQRAANVTTGTVVILAPQSMMQAQRAGALSLEITALLSPVNVKQAQVMDVVSSTQELVLGIQSVLQSQRMNAVDLQQAHILAVSSATQSQVMDAVRYGGVVIGTIDGKLVAYAELDGQLITYELPTSGLH